jgi:hypothetical protein
VLQYGRENLCFEISPVYFYSAQTIDSNIETWGFDANVGYRFWFTMDSPWTFDTAEQVVGASAITSVGLMITPLITDSFIPYVQIKLHHILFPLPSIALRLSLLPAMVGISIGYSFQMDF